MWGSKTVLGSTHVVEQLLFFYVSFNSDIWFWLKFLGFFTFWGPNGLFLGSMWGLKTVLGSTNVVEQLSFSMIPWILTFEFDLIWGHFNFFGSQWTIFVVGVGLKECFRSTHVVEQL